MNCEKCPHMKNIRAALAPCQNCDAGHLHGQRSIDSNSVDGVVPINVGVQSSESVTNLDEDSENALRKFLCNLFKLDPIKLLLVRHIVNGGGYSTFRKDLRAVIHRVIDRDYDVSDGSKTFRQIAHEWGLDVIAKIPQFEAISPKPIIKPRARTRHNACEASRIVGGIK